jgi:hydrogenase maturation factor
MSTDPMMVLLKANFRAGQLRRQAVNAPIANPGVLVGAATHSGAFLLQALEEEGWELRPKAEHPEDLGELVKRLLAAASAMDEVHQSISPGLARAVLEMAEQAGLGFTEGEDR